MIITRSPLRISLGGGGTDLPSYYRDYGPGFLIAAAIDKYVYITIHDTFEPGVILKYSRMERVERVIDVEHPIVREAMRFVGIENPHLEVASMADIPAGTGLGSSGSFTTALLKGLHAYRKNLVHPDELAAQACDIEINRLGEPLGKQDQYIAAFGGVTCFRFHKDERVEAWPLRASAETLHSLEDNLMLFFTGFTRSASSLLKDQDDKTKAKDNQMLRNMEFVKELGRKSLEALEAGNLRGFAELMNVHWEHKRNRTKGMSNDCIDVWYNAARQNGALGGKLIGAGGGGFLLFYTEDRSRLRHAMNTCGVREARFRFDYEGTKIIVT
jgi:D-glycero-alpha-D-manno-heptose-7-phosphate kinase